MYRIDNSTASNSLPTPGAVGPNPDSYFTAGNPSVGTPATIVDADWANSVQEAICRAIESSGITLDKTRYDLLRDAILKSGYLEAAGTDTYTASMPNGHALAAYLAGQRFYVKIANANTGAATLNINGLGAINIKTVNGLDVVAGELPAGLIAELIYDGTNFIVLNHVSVTKYAQVAMNFAQSIPPGHVDTKLLFNQVQNDSLSWWDNVNKRFIPNVAGKFRLNGILYCDVPPNEMFISLYRNGTLYKRINEQNGQGRIVVLSGSVIATANGTTDYFELYVTNNSNSSAVNVGAIPNLNIFEIEYLGA